MTGTFSTANQLSCKALEQWKLEALCMEFRRFGLYQQKAQCKIVDTAVLYNTSMKSTNSSIICIYRSEVQLHRGGVQLVVRQYIFGRHKSSTLHYCEGCICLGTERKAKPVLAAAHFLWRTSQTRPRLSQKSTRSFNLVANIGPK